jgi:hypothetical protein
LLINHLFTDDPVRSRYTSDTYADSFVNASNTSSETRTEFSPHRSESTTLEEVRSRYSNNYKMTHTTKVVASV